MLPITAVKDDVVVSRTRLIDQARPASRLMKSTRYRPGRTEVARYEADPLECPSAAFQLSTSVSKRCSICQPLAKNSVKVLPLRSARLGRINASGAKPSARAPTVIQSDCVVMAWLRLNELTTWIMPWGKRLAYQPDG